MGRRGGSIRAGETISEGQQKGKECREAWDALWEICCRAWVVDVSIW